mmetsp:Transcript_41068/g.36402  ORF Transcript_41068/g.36402 Transcript_41068/m.36402 type:complete len:100 (-) Transcript_41068:7-306(-)
MPLNVTIDEEHYNMSVSGFLVQVSSASGDISDLYCYNQFDEGELVIEDMGIDYILITGPSTFEISTPNIFATGGVISYKVKDYGEKIEDESKFLRIIDM